MKAVYYEEFEGPVTVTGVPDPEPRPDGVVIRVEASGLCRSDWHGWRGHDADITLPHVPGHELAGVIEAVGSGIESWRPGDRVTLPFVCGCGDCPPCHAGQPQVCDHQFQPGFTHWGSFAQWVHIHHAEQNLVRLPDQIDFVTAASLGCRFATAFRAVADLGQAGPGQWVAVHGCGGVGLSAVMIAAALGARVLAIDIRQESLDMARAAGAEATVLGAPGKDVAGEVLEATGGGAQLSIDALGHPQILLDSISSLATQGCHVQVGLLPPGQRRAPIPVDRVIARELRLLGSHGMQASRYPAMLDMILSGALDPGSLVTETIALEELPSRLVAMDRLGATGVTVVDRF